VKGRGMKNVLMGIAAVLVVSWADPAAAQAITGNKLLEYVSGAKRVDAGAARGSDLQDSAYLFGFALGVAVTLDIIDSKVCLPADSNGGQYRRVLIQYLEANPAELHKDGTTLAIAAFRRAFPCR
jgi:hypothetical protein